MPLWGGRSRRALARQAPGRSRRLDGGRGGRGIGSRALCADGPMLTSTLENVLNRGLPRSPPPQQLCAGLAGRRVGSAIARVLSAGAYVLVESTGVSLKLSAVTAAGTPADGPPPDAIVTGGPLS